MRIFSPIFLFRVLPILAGPIFISCSKEICDKIPDPVASVNFMTVNDAGRPVNAALDNVSIFAPGTDSLLYENTDNLSTIYLPLSPVYDTCMFVIKAGLIADTMLYIYSRNLVFVSVECGYAVNFDLRKIASTDNLIDSIIIINPEIRALDSTNVNIYF